MQFRDDGVGSDESCREEEYEEVFGFDEKLSWWVHHDVDVDSTGADRLKQLPLCNNWRGRMGW